MTEDMSHTNSFTGKAFSAKMELALMQVRSDIMQMSLHDLHHVISKSKGELHHRLTAHLNDIPYEDKQVAQCPDCDSFQLTCSTEIGEFEYGVGAKQVILKAAVPVWTCRHCSYSFTDGRAEELRHEAVLRYLEGINHD